jgi:ribosomal protein S18 acetylase RimI-like enzyme
MQTITHRPYRDSSDIARMKRICGRSFASDPGDMPFGGLEWIVFGPHGFPPTEIIEIWEDDRAELVGWALLDRADSFEFRLSGDLSGTSLEREVVEWGERGVIEWRRNNGLDSRCAVVCWSDDRERIELFAHRGYKPSDHASVLFSRSLDAPIDAPAPPAGWAVRGLSESDIDSRAETQYEAFSPGSKTTPATWRYLMKNAPGYDADLDNVAVNADGVVGAAALVWIDETNEIGEFEPVGTRPRFQRQGLGGAVLLRGLAKMRERGMKTAIVGTNATNAPAIAAYQSVGFKICNRSTEYVLAREPSVEVQRF